MAHKARVGVTGNARRWAPSWWCSQLALRLVGADPVRISVAHDPGEAPLDALIIGGGNDISPEHYDGDIHEKVRNDPERDQLEIRWIEHALERGLPLLGICRGAQLINVVLGGNLHQDILHMRRVTHNRPGLLPTKRVDVAAGSKLGQICGKHLLRVNSLHHQAIQDCGGGLRVVGRDLDDIVQAVEATGERHVIGVQWHPEYLFYVPAQLALFRALVQAGESAEA